MATLNALTQNPEKINHVYLKNFDFYRLKFENKFTNTAIFVCNHCGHCISVDYFEKHQPYTVCEECHKKTSFLLASYESLEFAVQESQIKTTLAFENDNKSHI